MRRKLNIEDIAQLADVSRGTVSRVLNHHPAVSAETRQKVLAVMAEADYRPNFSARHMRTDHSNLVAFGMITDDVITTPYAVDMIRGAQDALWARGKVMLVVNAGHSADANAISLRALQERRIEGIIYATMYHHAVAPSPQIAQTPVVLANCFSLTQGYPSVTPDEVSGGYAATRYLLDKGHRRIGFINLGNTEAGLAPPLPAADGRLAGYQQALADYAVAFDPALVRYTRQTPQANVQQTLDLMRLPNPPTAIFCGNDRTALGCYGALAQLGLRIPQDVAVVGFDNQVDIAQGLWPPLTTVQLPHYEMGLWAVEYLASADSAALEPVQHKIDCPLVVRESA